MLKILKSANLVLSLIILVLALYLISGPFFPRTGFIVNAKEWINDEVLHLNKNKIIIDSIGVNGEIHEGDSSELNFGFWRIPYTSTPDKGGNTVIIAHRFLYTYGPNTFFNLDKVNIGNEISLRWKNKNYIYKVSEVKKVNSSDVSIEGHTDEPTLTLYTCISLWDQSQRLVVIAKEIK